MSTTRYPHNFFRSRPNGRKEQLPAFLLGLSSPPLPNAAGGGTAPAVEAIAQPGQAKVAPKVQADIPDAALEEAAPQVADTLGFIFFKTPNNEAPVETKIRLDINMPSAEIVTRLLTSMNAPPGTLLRYRVPGQKKKQDSHPFTTEEQIRSAMRQVREKNNKATKHKDQHLTIVRADVNPPAGAGALANVIALPAAAGQAVAKAQAFERKRLDARRSIIQHHPCTAHNGVYCVVNPNPPYKHAQMPENLLAIWCTGVARGDEVVSIMPIGKQFYDWFKENTTLVKSPRGSAPRKPSEQPASSDSDVEIIEAKPPVVKAAALLFEPYTITQVLADLHIRRSQWRLPTLAPVFIRSHLAYADELSRFNPTQLAALDENLDEFKAKFILDYAKAINTENQNTGPSLVKRHKRTTQRQPAPQLHRVKEELKLARRQADIIELSDSSEGEVDELKDDPL